MSKLDERIVISVTQDFLKKQSLGLQLKQNQDRLDLSKIDFKKKPKVKFIIGSSKEYSMIVEAGLKDDFLNLFKRGKNFWEKTWNGIKDETTKAALKGINTAEKMKEFIQQHPNLKWAVLAALVLGYLAFPDIASADVFKPEQVSNMAKDLQWSIPNPGEINVHVPKGWVESVVMKSLEGHSTIDGSKILVDIQDNLKNILMEKGRSTGMITENKDAFLQLYKTTLEGVSNSINSWLAKLCVTG